eukprot:m.42149 g.42149  ORF g.42149 m.42149 type:complete len:304 (-) comp11896_c1_seq1:477-1388(-)
MAQSPYDARPWPQQTSPMMGGSLAFPGVPGLPTSAILAQQPYARTPAVWDPSMSALGSLPMVLPGQAMPSAVTPSLPFQTQLARGQPTTVNMMPSPQEVPLTEAQHGPSQTNLGEHETQRQQHLQPDALRARIIRDAKRSIQHVVANKAMTGTLIPNQIEVLKSLLEQVKTAPGPKVFEPEESESICQQCMRKRTLHKGAPLCMACVKHNAANIKHFLTRDPNARPAEDLEYYVFATLGRLYGHCKHTCKCEKGPSIFCECMSQNPGDADPGCVPCRFIRGLRYVIEYDMWPRNLRVHTKRSL